VYSPDGEAPPFKHLFCFLPGAAEIDELRRLTVQTHRRLTGAGTGESSTESPLKVKKAALNRLLV
jgi:hypothetical protein